MPTKILVGIGGTGAKCIEAAVHLAVSEPSNYTIYPIVIDQDKINGNILRLKEVIKAYKTLSNKGSGISRDWPFNNTIEFYDELLPIAPVNEDITFAAAIGEPSMVDDEKELINSLYTRSQLTDTIMNQGFKKRAHMGSILFEKFIEIERRKEQNDPGFNFIINRVRNEMYVSVFIYASLFGGTGISGFVNVGKFFKRYLETAEINVVLFSPYFKINSNDRENPDATLVKSDKDMLATRIALEIYGDEIQKVFDKIFLIGSDLETLGDEIVSETPNFYGAEQKNKAHLFEMIAGSLTFNNINENGVFNFFLPVRKDNPPVTIGTSEIIDWKKFFETINIKERNLRLCLDLANCLTEIKRSDLGDSWIDRQPWIKKDELQKLTDWGERYFTWFDDMVKWKVFNVSMKDLLSNPYKFSAKLSSYLYDNQNELKNLFKTLEILAKEEK